MAAPRPSPTSWTTTTRCCGSALRRGRRTTWWSSSSRFENESGVRRFGGYALRPAVPILPPSLVVWERIMNVLVAGGAGYIGSHTVKRLKEAGHSPVIYDNLSRGHKVVAEILKVPAVFADLNDRGSLVARLREHKIVTVMNFGAYAYVGG